MTDKENNFKNPFVINHKKKVVLKNAAEMAGPS